MEDLATKRAYSISEYGQQMAFDYDDARPNKLVKRGDTQAASQRHIKTEQARRDKISAGFQALQCLLPGREKVEKAMLLTQAAEYIAQLQGVLQMLVSSGAIGKLPDELQFQIRTLLPRRDGKPFTTALAPLVAEPAPPPAPTPAPQGPAASLLQGMQLPFLPLIAPGALQVPEFPKEMPKDEADLMGQIQALLQQQQQQTAAAQQLQTWQQTLQTLQLQQVLQQQQGQCVPNDLLTSLGGGGGGPNPLSSLGFMPTAPRGEDVLVAPEQQEAAVKPCVPIPRRPRDCYADELPKCGLQQLMDAAASEPAGPGGKPLSSPAPPKARKNVVKIRRHTTAARIPKPDAPNPARVGAGRPEPV